MFGGERIIKQPPGYHRLEAVKKEKVIIYNLTHQLIIHF